jgi:hypothetical protein
LGGTFVPEKSSFKKKSINYNFLNHNNEGETMMNLSEQKRISKSSGKKLSDSEKEIIVKRLRKEKRKDRPYVMGLEKGFDCAKNLSYQDLNFMLHWKTYDCSEIEDRHHILFDQDFFESNNFISKRASYESAPWFYWVTVRGSRFLDGFRDGVRDFWEEIKDSV